MGYLEESVVQLRRRIQVARGTIPADLVLRNAKLVNVCSGEIYQVDIALADGLVVGIDALEEEVTSRRYHGKAERDLEGHWVVPGLIDGHMHIESTMMVFPEFARLVVPRGVTAVILDPHEFANVMGIEGIRYVLTSSEH
jgi:adenine deaminase